MLNRPVNLFDQPGVTSRLGGRVWQTDSQPAFRIACLFALFVAPLTAVGGRLAYLQYATGEALTVAHDQTTETYEPIPTRDGRILASNGRILALDVERFSVHMHYRWLEEPADQVWLKRQALRQLSRKDRRDSALVAAARTRVVAQRDQMWIRLAALTDTPPDQLVELRQRIQRRVERIVEHVEERRRPGDDGNETQQPRSLTGSGWSWRGVWDQVVVALTTPPERDVRDPIVIKEEEDYHLVLSDIPLDAAADIEAHPDWYPGLRCQVTTRRVYPEGELAAHIVGSRAMLDARKLFERSQREPFGNSLDYQAGDDVGITGVERTYARRLRGLPGQRRIVQDRRHEVLHTETVREPRLGRDVVLTLSIPLQERAEAILDAALASFPNSDSPDADGDASDPATLNSQRLTRHGGSIVALDIHTGAILAAASAPRLDLNLLVNADHEAWQQLLSDPGRPLFPRVTQMTLPPGSVFKPITAAALLQSGGFNTEDTVHCRGYLDRPDRFRCYIYQHYGTGHGDMTLTDALCQSCNVYFFSGARRIGPEPIALWAHRFGFGQVTGVDLPGERPGNVPEPPGRTSGGTASNGAPASATRRRRSPWYPGDTLGLAIGQSRLTVTPLQVARMMAAVANGGFLVPLHVVHDDALAMNAPFADAEHDREAGFESLSPAPAVYRQPRRIPELSEHTLEQIREGLSNVVAHPRGTGYKRVRLEEIAIAGKTGTAEVGGDKTDHAWFAGYVPAQEPRIAFAVVLEHAGSGGKAAGPVARELVSSMLETGLLRPAPRQ